MRAGRLAVVISAGLAALVMVPSAMAAKKPPKLIATFGTGLTFDLKRGKKLLSTGTSGSASVKARKYRFVVRDRSSFHNFRLVNAKGKTIKGRLGKKNRKVLTGVVGTRKKATTYVINLKKGNYRLVCDPHETVDMTIDITVK